MDPSVKDLNSNETIDLCLNIQAQDSGTIITAEIFSGVEQGNSPHVTFTLPTIKENSFRTIAKSIYENVTRATLGTAREKKIAERNISNDANIFFTQLLTKPGSPGSATLGEVLRGTLRKAVEGRRIPLIHISGNINFFPWEFLQVEDKTYADVKGEAFLGFHANVFYGKISDSSAPITSAQRGEKNTGDSLDTLFGIFRNSSGKVIDYLKGAEKELEFFEKLPADIIKLDQLPTLDKAQRRQSVDIFRNKFFETPFNIRHLACHGYISGENDDLFTKAFKVVARRTSHSGPYGRLGKRVDKIFDDEGFIILLDRDFGLKKNELMAERNVDGYRLYANSDWLGFYNFCYAGNGLNPHAITLAMSTDESVDSACIIASVVKLNDEGGAILSESFYNKFLDASLRMTASQALFEARREHLASEHCLSASSYKMIGQPNLTLF